MIPSITLDAMRMLAPANETLDCRNPMILKQYYLGCLAHASYLLGDEASATASSSTPTRYPAIPGRRREIGPPDPSRLSHAFPRRFVAGHLELRDRCGAPSISALVLKLNITSCNEGRRYARVSRPSNAGARNSRPHHRVHLDPGVRPPEGRSKTHAVMTATHCSSATLAGPICGPPSLERR